MTSNEDFCIILGTFRATIRSVSQTFKNSCLLVRVQDGDEEYSAAQQKLRVNYILIKGNFAATLDHTENKLM